MGSCPRVSFRGHRACVFLLVNSTLELPLRCLAGHQGRESEHPLQKTATSTQQTGTHRTAPYYPPYLTVEGLCFGPLRMASAAGRQFTGVTQYGGVHSKEYWETPGEAWASTEVNHAKRRVCMCYLHKEPRFNIATDASANTNRRNGIAKYFFKLKLI
jgi:hypothetical protein